MLNALQIQDQRHQPELRFDPADKTASPWKFPEPQVINNPNSPGKIWQVRFLDLNFLPAPGVTLKEAFTLDQSIHDFLPNFAAFFPQASKINPVCLSLTPPESLIVIRVPLRHGTLTKTLLAFQPFLGIVDCTFAPKEGPGPTIPHIQKCAIEVAHEFTVEEGPLTLVGIPFGNYPSSGIAFEPPAGKTKVVVELENRPIDSEKTTLVSEYVSRDDDYSLHYNLSQDCFPDNKRFVPFYSPTLESGNCILGRFADDPGV
jgi:hypothetical protein